MNVFTKFATDKYRWLALVFLTLGLAIVIIDNSVLNVAIPYILRDLHTSFSNIQWVISGYALIIATLLITIGRLGDMVGRKKIFLFGTVLFAIGSFFASISHDIVLLFYGESFIEALGASMMLTSSLSLLVSQFQGKERAIAFGIWGSVAGVSATIGPLLGGYFTTYYSWRWSLRINVFVALIAVIGSVFIQESHGLGEKKFDWFGTIFSGLGLFSLVFALIEGENYGWIRPKIFSIDGWNWPFSNISIIPFAFGLAIIFLSLFFINEYVLESRGQSPLLKLSMFHYNGFSLGLVTLGIVSLGQFGLFFVLPIYLQNVLGLTAFKTGIVLLSCSLSIAVCGPVSGFIASKFDPKWVTTVGMFVLAIGTYLLHSSLSKTANGYSLAPALIVFGAGIGIASAQLTNIILSAVPPFYTGEASAASNTIRQIGTSVGTAIIGAILAASVHSNTVNNIYKDNVIPEKIKPPLLQRIQNINIESGQTSPSNVNNQTIALYIKNDIQSALVSASKDALLIALLFITTGAVVSLFIPNSQTQFHQESSEANSHQNESQIENKSQEDTTQPSNENSRTSPGRR